MGHVNGRIAHVKTMEWSEPTSDSASFIEEVYATMVQGLAELREGESVS
jgi:hypothetical protein